MFNSFLWILVYCNYFNVAGVRTIKTCLADSNIRIRDRFIEVIQQSNLFNFSLQIMFQDRNNVSGKFRGCFSKDIGKWTKLIKFWMIATCNDSLWPITSSSSKLVGLSLESERYKRIGNAEKTERARIEDVEV